MSFHRPTRRQLATHEAGHAYVYAALDGYEIPSSMGLGLDDRGPHGWSRRNTLLHWEVPFGSLPAECRPSIQAAADKEIAIAIAGPMSEFRHRHRSRWAAFMITVQNVEEFLRPDAFDVDGDFARIRSALAHVEEVQPAARLKDMISVADEVLTENWPRVCGLARLLLERGELAEAELAEWFDAHPARPRRHIR